MTQVAQCIHVHALYPLQLRPSRHKPHRLPHAQIRQNLLRTPQNRIKLIRAIKHLHHPAHARLRQRPAPKNIRRLIRHLMRTPRTECLQQRNRPAQLLALLRVAHLRHLVGDGFDPRLVRLDVLDDFGEFGADDGLVDEFFPEDLALVRPFEAFFEDGAGPAGDHCGHHEAFLGSWISTGVFSSMCWVGTTYMIKVTHNHHKPLILRPHQIRPRHLDIIELNIRRRRRRRITRLDGLRLHAFPPLNQQHRKPLGGLTPGHEVIAPHAVGDPLLRAVDDIVRAVLAEFRGGAQPGDVGAREGFRDGEADLLLAGEDFGRNAFAQGVVFAPGVHGGERDGHAGHVAVLEAAHVGADDFLRDDKVVEVVVVFALDDAAEDLAALQVFAGAETAGEEVCLGHLVDEFLRDVCAVLLFLHGFGDDVFLDEFADGSLEFAVAFVEVGRVEGFVQPEGFGVGDLGEVAGVVVDVLGFLAVERAHEEGLVLLEDFMAMKVVEGFGCVLAGDLTEDDFAAGVSVNEVGDVVDVVVDDEPEVFFGGVLC